LSHLAAAEKGFSDSQFVFTATLMGLSYFDSTPNYLNKFGHQPRINYLLHQFSLTNDMKRQKYFLIPSSTWKAQKSGHNHFGPNFEVEESFVVVSRA